MQSTVGVRVARFALPRFAEQEMQVWLPKCRPWAAPESGKLQWIYFGRQGVRSACWDWQCGNEAADCFGVFMFLKFMSQVGFRRVRSSLILHNMLLTALGSDSGARLVFKQTCWRVQLQTCLTWTSPRFRSFRNIQKWHSVCCALGLATWSHAFGIFKILRIQSIRAAAHPKLAELPPGCVNLATLAEGVVTYNTLGNGLEKQGQASECWMKALGIADMAKSHGEPLLNAPNVAECTWTQCRWKR